MTRTLYCPIAIPDRRINRRHTPSRYPRCAQSCRNRSYDVAIRTTIDTVQVSSDWPQTPYMPPGRAQNLPSACLLAILAKRARSEKRVNGSLGLSFFIEATSQTITAAFKIPKKRRRDFLGIVCFRITSLEKTARKAKGMMSTNRRKKQRG